MKKYFICSDIHSFYTEWMNSLKEKQFDKLNKDHYLIILGDLFDRGNEAKNIIEFIKELEDRVILIKGNHEDLFEELIKRGYPDIIDFYNGTYQTSISLFNDYLIHNDAYLNSDIYKYVISKMVNYLETDNYIFTHGFLPVLNDGSSYYINKDYKNASKEEWMEARWLNGMEYAETLIKDINKLNKKIVVGHIHSSYGHKRYENDYNNNDIFYGKHSIALDSCTVLSKKVNVLVLNEDEL